MRHSRIGIRELREDLSRAIRRVRRGAILEVRDRGVARPSGHRGRALTVEQAFATVEAMAHKGHFATSEGSAPPALRGLVLDFLEELEIRGRSDRTAANYCRYLQSFVAWIAADRSKASDNVTTNDVTADLLRRYRLHLARRRATRTGRPLAAATRNLYQIALRQFLRYCRRRRGLQVPEPDDVLELAKERDAEIPNLEREDVGRIAQAIPLGSRTGLRDRAIIETLFGTGVRVSELVGLRIRQVDLKRREAEVVGKGGRARLVLFTRNAAQWLRRYVDSRGDESPYLFVSRRRDTSGTPGRLGIRQVQRVVDGAAHRAGIPFRVSPHRFRHSRLTLVARQDVHIAQRIAGHASLATTSRYLHVGDRLLKSVYDKADEDGEDEQP